jgi:hypothetical protein
MIRSQTDPESERPDPCGPGRFLMSVARWTGLEPATPGVTGRYSNQLSYHRPTIRPVLAAPAWAAS